jgi:hypothetical protein
MFNANSFLGAGGSAAVGLNKSYAKLEPYYAALYWRFLYESCGGMRQRRGVDQAAGMQVIRDALTVLYGGDIVDIGSSNDLVGRLPQVVDQALEAASCPFKTHRGSLAAFARAIYALRLEGGRCRSPGIPGGCGLYDPHGLYRDPPVSAITYTGAPMMYDARHQPLPSGIPSSYGIDFVDVVLDPATDGRSLVLEFYGTPGSDAAFDVQLWKLKESGRGARRQRLVPHTAVAEILTGTNADGHVLYVIPAIDRTTYSRIGLIITRVDTNERSDSTGEYTIVLQPDVESPSGAR